MISKHAVRRDREGSGFAQGPRIAREFEGARIEGLSLDVSSEDEQQMPRCESRPVAGANHNSTLLRLTKHADFDLVLVG